MVQFLLQDEIGQLQSFYSASILVQRLQLFLQSVAHTKECHAFDKIYKAFRHAQEQKVQWMRKWAHVRDKDTNSGQWCSSQQVVLRGITESTYLYLEEFEDRTCCNWIGHAGHSCFGTSPTKYRPGPTPGICDWHASSYHHRGHAIQNPSPTVSMLSWQARIGPIIWIGVAILLGEA